jgi:hypothetical protein
MALSFATPFDCWMGLVSDGVEVSGAGYVRRPAEFLATAKNSVIGANIATVQWPPCGPDWGAIDTVNIYDALTGGHLIGTGLTTTIVQTAMYDILRVPAGGYQVYNAVRPLGFGTLTWGTGKYATWHYLTPPSSGLGSSYDVGPYGVGPYEYSEQTVLLLKTFGTVALCGGNPGIWAPGPFDVVAVS